MSCQAAPDNKHCLHAHTGPWFGITAPAPVCCWCGESNPGHGPHAHGRRPSLRERVQDELGRGGCPACGVSGAHFCTGGQEPVAYIDGGETANNP